MSTQQCCGNDRKYLHIASLIAGCSFPTIWLLGTHFFNFLFFLGLYIVVKQVEHLYSEHPTFHLNQAFLLFLKHKISDGVNQFHPISGRETRTKLKQPDKHPPRAHQSDVPIQLQGLIFNVTQGCHHFDNR